MTDTREYWHGRTGLPTPRHWPR